MKRILMMVFRNLLIVPFYWIKLNLYAMNPEKYTDEQKFELLKFIDHRANTTGNIEIKATGLENIPSDGGFLLTPNHQGLYDVLAILEVCPRMFSVVAKKELANIQFLKQVFTLVGAKMLDRNDTKQGLRVIIEVTKEIKEGKPYLIFPEGTRSKNGNNPGDFKGGSFKCATRAKAPIVPVALIDSFVPFDESSTRQVTVQVHFLKPLYYEEYKDMNTTEIASLVKTRIVESIKENTAN